MIKQRGILEQARLSVTEAFASGQAQALHYTAHVREASISRTIVAAALMVASGVLATSGIIRHHRDRDRIDILENNVLRSRIEVTLAQLTHLDAEANHITSTLPGSNQISLPQSSSRADTLLRQIDQVENVLNSLAPHINRTMSPTQNLLQQAQGKVIALRLKVQQHQRALETSNADLVQAHQTRQALLHNNPLALAFSDMQGPASPCRQEAIRQACTGPLHGVLCYAFTLGTQRRAMCETIKPICISCGLR